MMLCIHYTIGIIPYPEIGRQKGDGAMRLIFAVVQDMDAKLVVTELNKKGFGIVRLHTSRSLFHPAKATLLTWAADPDADTIIGIIIRLSRCRMELVSTSIPHGGPGGNFIPYPVEIRVGGTTTFSLKVERHVHITPDGGRRETRY